MKLYGFVCGTLTAPMEGFAEGGAGTITVPVPAYYIEHPRGRVVIDTGMPPAMRDDPQTAIGRFLAGVFKADFTRGEDIDRQLALIGVDAASIDTVVNTHLHFDHCAGNHLLPNARIVLQRPELEAARAASPPKSGFDPMSELDGRDVQAIDGEHDLFGDGSVVLLPTYGHTPGHQSVKFACDGGETVLMGDCCYFHRTLSDMILPAFTLDAAEQRRSIARLKGLADRGARMIAGHDPEQWPGKDPVLLAGG